jgi:hypothetical protein
VKVHSCVELLHVSWYLLASSRAMLPQAPVFLISNCSLQKSKVLRVALPDRALHEPSLSITRRDGSSSLATS